MPYEEDQALLTAQDFFQLSIYGPLGDHVVTLKLQKRTGMTIGDMAQLQNFFWVSLGNAIREDEEMKRHLRHAGFEILIDDPRDQGSATAN